MFNFVDVKIDNFNLKVLKSDIFSDKLEHFFTTRTGGDTPEPLNSFTLSAKDFPEYDNYAQKNLKIACDLIGGKFENLIMPNQQHTDKILIIENKNDINKIKDEPFDGIITNLKNYPICLVFADCIPVLLFDEKNEVVACIHAGWKGTAKSIVKKTVKLMQQNFNSYEKDIKAVIGAGICQNCFEVNSDVKNQLAMSLNYACDNIFIKNNDKTNVDLKKLNEMQLKEVGVQNTDVCKYCTFCNNDIFYSYRADNRCTGRHGMLAMIKE